MEKYTYPKNNIPIKPVTEAYPEINRRHREKNRNIDLNNNTNNNNYK
jgi:hypothetical protein